MSPCHKCQHICSYTEHNFKQTKAWITSVNFVFKIIVSKVSVCLFFSCLEKEVTVFRWYCSAGLQKELWVWPHFHCEADKDASSHTGDNVLTPVNHLFPNFITLRLFSVKTQSPDAEHPNSLSDCLLCYILFITVLTVFPNGLRPTTYLLII